MSKENQDTTETLEECFEKVENVIEFLEKDPESLEEAFDEYKKGVEYIKKCYDRIDMVEKKILALEEDGSVHEFE